MRIETCSSEPPPVLAANLFAWRCFRDALWQFTGNGFGEASVNGVFVQQMMADRGVKGGLRDVEMNRFRVLAETFHDMQRMRQKEKAPATGEEDPEE